MARPFPHHSASVVLRTVVLSYKLFVCMATPWLPFLRHLVTGSSVTHRCQTLTPLTGATGGSDSGAYHPLRQLCNSHLRFAMPTSGVRAGVQSPLLLTYPSPPPRVCRSIPTFLPPLLQPVLLPPDPNSMTLCNAVVPTVPHITSFVRFATRTVDLQCQQWACALWSIAGCVITPFFFC
jgi:hypothetical protein